MKENPRKFYRYSEGVKLGVYAQQDRDEIVVHAEEGIEFVVCQHRLNRYGSSDTTAIRVEVFSGSFHAFKTLAVFFKWIAKARPLTLDEVQKMLVDLGFRNGIPKTKKKAVAR